MRSLLFLSIAASVASAQPFGAGLKLGVPLTDFVDTAVQGNFSASTATNRYILGVEGELRLPFGLGIELDALYRRVNYTLTSTAAANPATITETAATTSNNWEFPLVAKYRFKAHIVRPYVEAGVAWQTLQGLTEAVKTFGAGAAGSSSSTSNSTELANNTTRGFVLGGGVDIHALVIHVTPEIRFTRWGAKQFFAPGLLSSNQNQAEFLVGVTF